MSYKAVVADIKRKNFKPVYLLSGEEAFYIDKITSLLETSVLDDMEKEFNQTILYGRDTDIGTILECAKRFPMMSNHQVVIVKEAQHLKKVEELESYFNNPLETTVLILCWKHKKFDKRKRVAKLAAEKGVFFESKRLYESQVPDWIREYCKEHSYEIDTKACVLLTEFLGNDLGKIANEVEKLMLNIPAGSPITPDHIEHFIGISKDYNNFELQNALGQRDIAKANRIVQHFAANPKNHPLVVTLSLLYGFFSKLLAYHYTRDKSQSHLASVLKVSPYFVKDYQRAGGQYNAKKVVRVIGYLREYDLKSKGMNNTSTSDGELLKELVYKILH